MSPSAKLVPTWVRVLAGLLALFNLAYGLSGYFAPAGIFPGVDPSTPALLNAVHMFTARNLAIGIALVIVSLVGVPETISILMIIRFLVEAQDLILNIISGAGIGGIAIPIVVMVIEAVIILTMFRIVGERDKASH